MQELIDKYISKLTQQQEQIIKEIAEQGYKYLIIKKRVDNIDESNTIKCNYKYRGANSLDGTEIYSRTGYTIYDLSRVNEYLSKRNQG